LFTATLCHAQTFTASLTADNHYQLFVGDANGSLLSFVGQNEASSAGSPGANNWSVPENWNFNLGAGQFIYVVAWDAGGIGGWLGQFSTLAGTILSRPASWRYYQTTLTNPGDSQPNMTVTMASQIATAQAGNLWLSNPTSYGINGTSPWGTIAGIGSAAEWLSVPSNSGPVVVFRSDLSAIPEPGTTAACVAVIAGGAWTWLRRRRDA
jgi:hypothetical protein